MKIEYSKEVLDLLDGLYQEISDDEYSDGIYTETLQDLMLCYEFKDWAEQLYRLDYGFDNLNLFYEQDPDGFVDFVDYAEKILLNFLNDHHFFQKYNKKQKAISCALIGDLTATILDKEVSNFHIYNELRYSIFSSVVSLDTMKKIHELVMLDLDLNKDDGFLISLYSPESTKTIAMEHIKSLEEDGHFFNKTTGSQNKRKKKKFSKKLRSYMMFQTVNKRQKDKTLNYIPKVRASSLLKKDGVNVEPDSVEKSFFELKKRISEINIGN